MHFPPHPNARPTPRINININKVGVYSEKVGEIEMGKDGETQHEPGDNAHHD
jgi:hypothetical protein